MVGEGLNCLFSAASIRAPILPGELARHGHLAASPIEKPKDRNLDAKGSALTPALFDSNRKWQGTLPSPIRQSKFGAPMEAAKPTKVPASAPISLP
jgi:hypothetical protein